MGIPRFTPKFKEEAVRQITERGYSVAEVSERLWPSPISKGRSVHTLNLHVVLHSLIFAVYYHFKRRKTSNEVHIMGQNPLALRSRRTILKQTLAISALSFTGLGALSMPSISFAASLSKEERDGMSPLAVIEHFKLGNLRFRENRPVKHDYLAQKRNSIAGQYPAAVILSCIDSRVPAEIVLDAGIGETFNSRVAGNIINRDILGSMEFACAIAGAKLVLVMGHTRCGAVRGAIDNVEMGNLTGLLDEIKPAIEKTEYSGERKGSNYDFVDAVARVNVDMTIKKIRKNSSILKKMEDQQKIKIIGSMYHLTGGKVEFFNV
ncbi:hypothetical protein SERMPA_00043 (plasmid) [Serratia marcescens]